MAATVGQLLEILAVPELAHLYESTIRKLQPSELVHRLGIERVSTRGHMPELRGRLLRLEALKLHPELEVPWYPEDFARVLVEPAVQNRDEDLLNKFFQVARYQETKLREMRSRLPTTGREKGTHAPHGGGRFDAVLDEMNKTMKEYLKAGEQRVDSAEVETSDEIVDESEYKFDANLDAETRRNINDESESDRSLDSIVKIGFDQLQFFENPDKESADSWGKDVWTYDTSNDICTIRMNEVD